MRSFKTIFAFLPIAYVILAWLFFKNSYEVLGVVMIIFSVMFGLMAFMLSATDIQQRKSSYPSNVDLSSEDLKLSRRPNTNRNS